MRNVIEIDGLSKVYRRRRGTTKAVDRLDLAVPEGGVFGFLGPNGSGKTTTIRCVLGLVRPTRGRVELLGQGVPGGLPETMRHTGAIVESPALFPTMSGRENLRLLGAIDRIGTRRVDDVLEQVGLAERGGDVVKKYSLGMRQRLALAAALLKDPAVLILDEPANGLDPAGMRAVRDLVRSLGRDGRTVFVSSHILSEIELMCDRVAILSEGRCLVQGTVDEVMASAGRAATMVVGLADVDAGAQVLRGAGFSVERTDGHLRVAAPASEAAHVSRVLGEQRLWVTELRAEGQSLEDLFLELTSPDIESMGAAVGPAQTEHAEVAS